MRASRALATTAVLALAAVLPLTASTPSAAGPPSCDGKPATVVGTTGDDVLEGTKKADVIVALAGDDVVRGKGGNDRICGGNGSDKLYGGPGDDRLFGGYDRRGDDPAGTFLVGDLLDGGDGDDLLVGVADPRPAESVRTPDTFSFAESPVGVVVDLSTEPGTATGQGSDELRWGRTAGIEGSAHADTLTGSSGPDWINGLAGDDTISGGDGDDTLFGEKVGADEGDDLVRGGTGADLLGSYVGRDDLRGGAGDDFVEAYSDKPTRVAGDRGNDYVAQNVTAGSGAGSDGGGGRDVLALYGDLLAGVEPRPQHTIDLRDGTTSTSLDPPTSGTIGKFEEYRLVGNLRWRFHGTPLRDRVWAITGGPLQAWGYGGDDWLHGSPRQDLLNGGQGHDTGVRGGGRDTCLSIESGC